MRILTPGVYDDAIVLLSSKVEDTKIAETICRKTVCADLTEVRTAIKKIDRSTTAEGLTLDLVGHCNGTTFLVGDWVLFDSGDNKALRGLRELRDLLRQKNVTNVRFLGCASALVRGLLDGASEALNAGVSSNEEIMVSGTREKLNYRHFNAAGLKCSRESVLYRRRRGVEALGGELAPDGFDVTSPNIVLARRKAFGGTVRWAIHRVNVQSVRDYVRRIVGRQMRTSIGSEHLLLPDVEYVFCLHEKAQCTCTAVKTFSLSFDRRLLAYRAGGREVVIQYRNRLPVLVAQ